MVRISFQNIIFWTFIFLVLISGISLNYKNSTMPKIPEKFITKEFQTSKDEVLIGIISDTHIPTRVNVLPREVGDVFKDVDLIIHAGDIENLETLEELKKIAPVIAVWGNMDFPQTKEKLPEALALKIYNWRIGIIHSPISGWVNSHFNWQQEKAGEKLAEKENFDILIFGHTHRSYSKEKKLDEKMILLINPGSSTVPLLTKPSVGLLRITKDSFSGEIINLK